ncbi:pentatricopeptide repeat-containing protein At4g02750 [Cryptomeria japonica]|uniref:pentatricopeptide repeat-containing protein At4g02750 n=1 Tax=Cryptomeria japonica TaxID=3369 RepID=UPI0027DA564A|nr:pentatricopeptide repeat-containing protein At4g02750 [Cryptomeria japonica]
MNLARHRRYLFKGNKNFVSIFWNHSISINGQCLHNANFTTVSADYISNCRDHLQTGDYAFDVVSCNSKISAFAQRGQIEDAREVFDKMPERDVVSWNAIISGYARYGRIEDARQLFEDMPERSVVSWNAMIAGYARNGNIEEAYRLFNEMPERDFISWTAMITGCYQNGKIEYARQLFDKMPERTIVSWNAMLAGEISNDRIDEARQLFDEMPERNVASWNSMITGYARLRRIDNARELFDKMSERNIVSWTAMISGCVQNGLSEEALGYFYQMQKEGLEPNQSTFTSVINSCTSLVALDCGKHIHAHIIKKGFELNVYIASALVNMYADCGDMENACELFSNTTEGNVVLFTSIITGYAKNGKIQYARQLFDRMPERNLVSWNAMIAGYVQNRHAEEALELFYQMQYTSMKYNHFTLNSIISACTNQAVLEQGQQIHTLVKKSGFESNVFLLNALIGMYSKCGNIDDAFEVFSSIHEKSVVSWTAMVAGYAQHGHCREALHLFEQMKNVGLNPNHITFIGILSACSHGGLVKEGRQYFYLMSQEYGITPRMEHYGCMVDILGRDGNLGEAVDLIRRMPFEPNVVVWRALFRACRVHQDMELGQLAAEQLFKLEPQNAARYVVLSNIYALGGWFNDAENLQLMRKERGLTKILGCCWIVSSGRVHKFIAGDRAHPQTETIYATLENLAWQLKGLGYTPVKDFVLHDVEDELKKHILPYHSEKLAIAFGLITLPVGTSLRIIKNLRICPDCHNYARFISRIISQEVIIRDSTCFHHFKDGYCSCKDYW